MRSVCLAVIGLLACGDDGGGEPGAGSEDTTCSLSLRLGGALELSLPASRSSTGCGSSTSFESGIDAAFFLLEGELAHVDLEVDDVTAGETGSFAARLTVVHQDGRQWSAEGCTAQIAAHEHVGAAELGWERYRVVGDVSCAGPASAGADAGADAGSGLEIEELAFVVTISWG